jgi:PAS domain-containing protein
MYFWKDINRRFMGASRSFLDYYGFGSVKEILGKTDEDMGWHVEPNAFMKDELDVLQNGSRVLLAKGKCIARGKQRTILASKIPIYRDGKIVGLMGSFFDAENLTRSLTDKYQSCAQPRVCSLTGGNPVYPRPNQPDISESWDGASNDT